MDRICVLRRLEERDLIQREAGDELGLSVRQIRRLYKRLKQSGPPGIKRLPQGGNKTFPKGFESVHLKIHKNLS
jgi:predicted DNA-binding transcriptional regulator YafY